MSAKSNHYRVLVVCIFLSGFLWSAEPPQKPSEVRVRDLAFITGHWEGSMNGDRVEEQWSLPTGDSMMGMFKWMKGDKTEMYEFLSIEQESAGPVLKLKHFHRGLVGWEEKTKVWEYPLVEFSKDSARFESADKKTMLSYRLASADTLIAVLEQVKNGKLEKETFEYHRAK